jgi:hypothetical protein
VRRSDDAGHTWRKADMRGKFVKSLGPSPVAAVLPVPESGASEASMGPTRQGGGARRGRRPRRPPCFLFLAERRDDCPGALVHRGGRVARIDFYDDDVDGVAGDRVSNPKINRSRLVSYRYGGVAWVLRVRLAPSQDSRSPTEQAAYSEGHSCSSRALGTPSSLPAQHL